MQLTYFGHSCFLLETGGSRLLFDPFIRPNPLAKDVDVDAIEADYLLLSHGHGDHVADAEEIGKRTGAALIGMFELANWFGARGLNARYGMNLGGTLRLPFGTVKMVPALHSNSLPDGSYGGPAVGFVVESEGKTLYFAGDTALSYEMKTLAEQHAIDVALLPIGDLFTMGIDDALTAARWAGAPRVVGMHYDTFPPIALNHEEAQAKAQRAGKELLLLKIGETITI
ncbi:metal-dependent hydrolase [Hymenobacter sp. J193]|uniref:metal-dependent hydrolase n=1 Tax=Hymenobacter sp. J193 TaxID=2898429 RepID=UPI0021517317|nr:metal-dependent hydrolase [Hymenobacter sp. J193]MCR5889030.1 metal-dependent hydrolase [Hymenobacter sp. J193]